MGFEIPDLSKKTEQNQQQQQPPKPETSPENVVQEIPQTVPDTDDSGLLGSEDLWRDWTAAIEPAHDPIEIASGVAPKTESPSQTAAQSQQQTVPQPTGENVPPTHAWLKYIPWAAAGILVVLGIGIFIKGRFNRPDDMGPHRSQSPQEPAPPPPPPQPKGYVVP